ncbi:MAG: hypothetical protein A2Y15_02245 [Clostridiales bacterium GWF2_36_10]|nr:MAG: hypothetical protein A2Y15_02245 [Clostridiales bacterium GWF2_36_10]HAN21284.1 hypothetical protein [Clostridiales bacterium]
MEPFSVLMSVYKNEKPDFFKTAMDSVLNQTVRPDEIILIRDGYVPEELQKVIDDYIHDTALFTYIPLEINGGLGNALKIGIEKSRNEIIARMDTDDISVHNRFELQLKCFEKNKELSVAGGQIEEFISDRCSIVGKRAVPLADYNIKKFLKKRNPLNHMSVMYKRSDVLTAGNYQELFFLEDYFLWCRMFLKGCKFVNVPETLIYARVGKEMYQRRGGYKYFKSWKVLERFKLKNRIISFFTYIVNLIERFIVQVMMPNKIRGWMFKRFARVKSNQ